MKSRVIEALLDARHADTAVTVSDAGFDLDGHLDRIEADIIRRYLVFAGSARQAAKLLQLPRGTFIDRATRLGIRLPDRRGLVVVERSA